VMHGLASATALHQAAEDSLDRAFTVLYVGDYDPSGMHMSEVDIPARLERYEAEIDVIRIALRDYDTDDLPPFDLATRRGTDGTTGSGNATAIAAGSSTP
jgi:hypothetical protein